jgi:predicted O-methyltransferase YrrM
VDAAYWMGAARALGRQVRDKKFLRYLATAGLRAEGDRLVPSLYLLDVYPQLEREIDLGRVVYRMFNLDPLEQYVLAGFAQTRDPHCIFEIGTYDGATTLLLARNAPEAQVITIDLPAHQLEHLSEKDRGGLTPESIGYRFRDQPEATRITQLRGDSRTFDFSAWYGSADIVLVDADHDYEAVKADTATALRLVAPGGLVVWDDYTDSWPGVQAAVREAAVSAVALVPTGLAVHDRFGEGR